MKVTKFDVILNVWLSLLVGAVLSFALPMIANGSVTMGEYWSGVGISFVLGFVVALVLPVVKWGDKFAGLLKAKPFSVPRQLLSTIVLALIMGTIMSFCMTWWGLHRIPGYTNFLVMAWLKAYPWALLVIYVTANISLWTGIPLTKKILGIPSGPPPENMPAEESR